MIDSSVLINLKVRVDRKSGLIYGSDDTGRIKEVSHMYDKPNTPVVFFIIGRCINGGAGAYIDLSYITFLSNENDTNSKRKTKKNAPFTY